MVYLGRVVGIGKNDDGLDFGVYAVSGRSEMSKQRRAEIAGNSVSIGPSGELTEEQKKMSNLIFYDAIRVPEMPNEQEHLPLVLSNGVHTNDIEKYLRSYSRLNSVESALADNGVEPDKYRTPRIAGAAQVPFGAVLGIVTEDGIGVSNFTDSFLSKKPFVSTYCGDENDPKEIVIPRISLPTGYLDVNGRTAQELADSMYGWMDQDLVVCSAAALWLPDKKQWEIAVRNLHE